MAICCNCPFFSNEKNGKIFCEMAIIKSPDKQTRNDILLNYCAHEENYKKCSLYIMLEGYYNRKYNIDN